MQGVLLRDAFRCHKTLRSRLSRKSGERKGGGSPRPFAFRGEVKKSMSWIHGRGNAQTVAMFEWRACYP